MRIHIVEALEAFTDQHTRYLSWWGIHVDHYHARYFERSNRVYVFIETENPNDRTRSTLDLLYGDMTITFTATNGITWVITHFR